MNSELTMVMCNFARPAQMEEVLHNLRKQTVKPVIVLWHNGPERITENLARAADWVIESSRNVHSNYLPMLYQQADTPYVGRMDDDLNFNDDRVLEDMISTLRDDPAEGRIVGAFGVKLITGRTYQTSDHINMNNAHIPPGTNPAVDLVKGRLMVMARESADYLLPREICKYVHADLYASFKTAGPFRRHHRLCGKLLAEQPRLFDYPADDLGYNRDPMAHYAARDVICQKWLETTSEIWSGSTNEELAS